MRKINVVCCFLLATLFIICTSCKEERVKPGSGIITLDTKSGDGIRRSIDLIRVPQNWTQERYDTINEAINALASAGLLNRNINEDKEHLASLITSSASCLEEKVDSIFRQPEYKGYAQMKDDLEFLKRYYSLYLDAGVDIDQESPSLTKVTKLFVEYEKRLNLSRRSFGQEARFLVPYNQNYLSTVQAIKEDQAPNKYWSTYFCHNKEIVTGVNALPSRLNDSRRNYYSNLEQLIENIAVRENYTKERLEDVENRFYQMANEYNQDAISKLSSFRKNYTPRIDDLE